MMSDPDANNQALDDLIKSQVPNMWVAYLPELASLFRDGLKLAGACGFTWALTVNGSQVQMAATAAMVGAGMIWSQIQKFRAKRAIRKAALLPPAAAAEVKLPA